MMSMTKFARAEWSSIFKALAFNSKAEQLEAVTEALSAVLRNREWGIAAAHILRAVLRRTKSEYAFLGVVMDGKTIRVLAFEGLHWNDTVGQELYRKAQHTFNELGYFEFTNLRNLFGAAATSGQTVVSNDPARDPRSGGLPPGHPALHNFLGLPIIQAGKVIGVIGVANRPGGYCDSDEARLQTLIQAAGIVCDSYHQRERETLLENQFCQAQKLEAVGRLAGGIAHDFNNMLTVIIGYCKNILFDLDEGALSREIMEVEKAAERAALLAKQLLGFSRKQVLELRIVDLNSLLADLKEMLQRLIGEDISLVISTDREQACAKVDPGQIEQIMMNLATNARDAMPQGGRLTIETRNVELDEAFTAMHPSVRPGSYVRLTVSDTGHGMDADTKSRIFEPFFTTKEPGKGTGLGLATVHGIVTQSGGSIWVESEQGRGCVFTIYLPRATAKIEVSPKAEARTIGPDGSETILLVEDEPTVRTMMRTLLEKHGYTVLEAGDGADALRAAQEHRAPIHMLLTDVVMPEMSGCELADRMASLFPTIKVLYISGHTDDIVLLHKITGSQAAFLRKPFSPEGLALKIREVLEGIP